MPLAEVYGLMFNLYIPLLIFLIVLGIDIFRVIRQSRLSGLAQGDTKALVFLQFIALGAFFIVIFLAFKSDMGSNIIFFVSLMVLWKALFELVMILLKAAGKRE